MAQKKPTVYEFVPKLGQLRDDVLFGDVWEHPGLSKRDRSCACGSSRGTACGTGGVMAWGRGRGEGAPGRGGALMSPSLSAREEAANVRCGVGLLEVPEAAPGGARGGSVRVWQITLGGRGPPTRRSPLMSTIL